MRIITKYELEEGDLELLQKELPDNTCEQCADHECYHCDEENKYEDCVKIYKERNLYELAQEMKKVYEYDRKLKEIKKKQMEVVRSINEKIGVPVIRRVDKKERKEWQIVQPK